MARSEEEYIRDCILYVFGSIKYLEDNLRLQDGTVAITPKGLARYDQLVAEKFKPSNADIFEVLVSDDFIDPNSLHTVYSLILELRDLGWKKFEDKYHANSEQVEEDYP